MDSINSSDPLDPGIFSRTKLENSSVFDHDLKIDDPKENFGFQPPIFEFAVQGISITTVSILGLCANIICLIVMNRPSLKTGQCSSISALLTSMAAVDIIVLVCR